MSGEPWIDADSLRELIAGLVADVECMSVTRLGIDDDTGEGQETEKRFGYGVPLHIRVSTAAGERRQYVLHTARPDIFGHDRRSDRAQNMLLCADTFGSIPRHVAALDVGGITAEGKLRSLGRCRDFYLLTEYMPGSLYADDLRRLAHERVLTDRDRRRCVLLADYLAVLHGQGIVPDRAGAGDSEGDGGVQAQAVYRRAIRDLVGHGEGIFGIIDGYPDQATPDLRERLRSIERACCEWRWKLRGREHRLARTHGDFHPFNILFDGRDGRDELALLDASRGCRGDPADDVTCLAINYIFFSLGDNQAWRGAFGELWHTFWDRYLDRSGDRAILDVAPPFFAWRGLVLANPTWYPAMLPEHRDALLGLVEHVLGAGRLEPAHAERLFP